MRLNKNMFSLKIYDSYKDRLKANSHSIQNISSGLKLNKAKDNPGKISQSESLKIQITSNDMANRNIQDTNSMIQTFDSAMSEMNDTLLRLKELTIQSGGAMDSVDRNAVQLEIDALTEHIDYMAKNTDFNGVKLLDGNAPLKVKSTIGSMEGDTIELNKFNLTKNGLGINSVDITNPSNRNSSIEAIDNAINMVSSARSEYGAIQIRLTNTGDNLDSSSISLQRSQSNIADTDMAEEMLKYSESQILVQSSLALMAQSNNFPQDTLRILQNIK